MTRTAAIHGAKRGKASIYEPLKSWRRFRNPSARYFQVEVLEPPIGRFVCDEEKARHSCHSQFAGLDLIQPIHITTDYADRLTLQNAVAIIELRGGAVW